MRLFRTELYEIKPNDKSEDYMWDIVTATFPIDIMFGVWMLIISFPIFIVAIFVFLPIPMMILFAMCLILYGVYYPLQKLVNVGDFGLGSGTITSFNIGCLWVMITVIVSGMEYYDHWNWSKAFNIGFLGRYCDHDDYFKFEKWNEYSWDIKFLIISWVIF